MNFLYEPAWDGDHPFPYEGSGGGRIKELGRAIVHKKNPTCGILFMYIVIVYQSMV